MECFSKKPLLSTIDSTGSDAVLQQIKFEPTDKRQNFYSFDLKLPIISSTALMLAACGGGGGGGGGDESPSTSSGNTSSGNTSSGNTGSGNTGSGNKGSSNTGPDSSKPTQKPNNPSTLLTDTDAARFLQQAQFSSTKAEIESLKSIGIHQWLNNQFAMPIAITGYDWLLQQGINNDRYRFDSNPVDWMAWQQLFSSKDTLRKRTALALSEILVVSSHGVALPLHSFSIAAYWDVLNEHAFGNFRDLLKAITLNLAMGDFLDLISSKKANDRGRRPDENFARELMQLFTIGLVELNLDGTPKLNGGQPIETYTQETVTNVAQALTGWSVDESYDTHYTTTDPSAHRAPMVNSPDNHDTRSVSFFGVTVPAGASGEQALDIVMDTLFNHANVAPFISKQLIQRLVTSNPSPDYVRRVATVFNKDGSGTRGNLRSVLQAILTDTEARKLPAKNTPTIGKVREPIVRYIQWVHTFTNRKSISGEWAISNTLSSRWHFNQSPLKGPSVFNFFDVDYAPSTSDFVSNNLVAPELQLHNETSTVGYINFMKIIIQNGVHYLFDESQPEILPEYSEEMKLYDQPEKLVAHLNLVLCANQMSDDTTSLIVEALEDITDRDPDWGKNRVYSAVLLTMASPEYLVQK